MINIWFWGGKNWCNEKLHYFNFCLNSLPVIARAETARVHFILHKRSKTAPYKIRRDTASLLAEFVKASLRLEPPPTVPKSATKRSPFNPRTLTTGTSDDLAIRKIGPHYEIIVIPLYEMGGNERGRGEGEPSRRPRRQTFFRLKYGKRSPRGWSSETHNGTGRPILAPLNHVRNDRDEGSAHRRILYPSKQHPSPRDTDSVLARREKKQGRRKKKIKSALPWISMRRGIISRLRTDKKQRA